MASSSIHLAVSKLYLEKSNIIHNKEEVLQGTLYPDTVENKAISHFTDKDRGKDIISHLQGKVNLYNFLLQNSTLSDFEFGWFIHLVTDYLFFDECFSKEYLLTHTYQEFRKDLYFSYDCLNEYIINKYGITLEDYTIYLNEYYPGKAYQACLFSKDMLDNFIVRVASIDFERYIKEIKLHKRNIKP